MHALAVRAPPREDPLFELSLRPRSEDRASIETKTPGPEGRLQPAWILPRASERSFLPEGPRPAGSAAVSGLVPEISRFLGITVRMFHDDHGPPHFHAEYAGC